MIFHHVWVEQALIPSFHDRNVLVEPFVMLIAYLTQNRWEEIKMRMQEVHFKRHPTAHSLIPDTVQLYGSQESSAQPTQMLPMLQTQVGLVNFF